MVNNQVLKEFLKKRFQISSLNCGPYSYLRLNHGLEQTPIYNAYMPIPKTPIFHPYNPTGTTKEQMKDGTGGVPGVILSVKFDNEVLKNLPESINKVIAENKIAKENIDCFFVTQNMPWKNEPLLIRPNYWLHGDKKLHDEAARTHTLNATTACRVGIFSPTTTNITIDNTKDVLPATVLNYVTHPGTDGNEKPTCIVSPDGIGVMGGIDLNRTDSLFSVVLSGNRLAVTLHWLLDDGDQQLLTNMSHHIKNLEELIESIQMLPSSRLNEKNGPLSHLQQILNMDPKNTIKDQKDCKHSADKATAYTKASGDKSAGKDDVVVEDPTVQMQILKQIQTEAAQLKEQDDLLKAFALKKEKDFKQQQEFLILSEKATFMSLYENQISILKQKYKKIIKTIDDLIDLQNNRKEKSEDISNSLDMAFRISELIQLFFKDDPAKRDQSKLDAMIKIISYIDPRMRELENCIKNLKILSSVIPEQKPIAGVTR